MMYTKKRALMAAKFTLILKTMAQALGLLVTILLVKILSEDEFGVYNTFISAMAVTGSLFSFGIGNTLQRYIPKYAARGEYFLTKKIVRIAFLVRLLSLIILCAIGYIFRYELAGWFNVAPYLAVMVPFLFVMVLHFQTRLLATILSACLFQGVTQTAQVTLVLSKVLLYTLLGQLEYGFELEYVVFADIAAYTLMLLIVLIGYYKYMRPLCGGRTRFDKLESKGVLKYAAFNNLNDVGVVSLGRDVDVLFLASMDGVESAGAYAFANRISHSLKQISPVRYFIDVIRPLFFTLDPVRESKRSKLYFGLLVKLNYMFELPFACALFIVYPALVEYLFEGKFIEYRLLVVCVYLIVISSSFGLYVGLLAQLKERADILLYSKVFSIVNVVGNLLLIPIIGVYGAVISTFVSVLAKDIFVLIFVRDDMSMQGIIKFIGISSLYWVLVAALSEVVALNVEGALVSALLGLLLSVAAYFLYIKQGLFDSDEVEAVKEMVGKSTKKLKLIGL